MFALVALSAELAEQLVAVETGGDDAVHQARTRVRRLRSVLGVYRRAFRPDETRRMRDRLRELGAVLGETRDLEVRADDLENLLAAQTAPDVVDAVLGFSQQARDAYDASLTSLLGHLRSRSNRILLADLQVFAAEPPLRGRGRKHPDRVGSAGLANARRRVTDGGQDTLEELHELRKAARRLRYAADAMTDTFGRKAVRTAAAAEAVQDALGDHRDFVLLGMHLRARAADAELSASAAAGVARLAADCDSEAAARLDELPALVAAVGDAA
ncbi:CHAD domain-containing protein [Leifsonia sp. NPDC058248]|uniref:CHAD domain-containing protein n=1 Tax=Leifsonia sp. NPDC058248 TaxID=3346402 RepID=UPI0036DB2C4E